MAHELVDQLVEKFKTEPMKKGQPDWSINGRNLQIALFYGVLGEKVPRGTKKDKMPSLKADIMEKFESPLAAKIVEFRSDSHTLSSLEGCTNFLYPASEFGVEEEAFENLALVQYEISGYDNVERIFTKAQASIPVSADRRLRNAMVANPGEDTSIPKDSLAARLVFGELT